ncbi:MAG: hypothetical protein L6301_00885 [Desulfobacteraceae bacterium]|nr:hypothetical protein [Desulfobacteraceae bacterium]
MKNDVSQVIDRTDLIENILNQIIEKYTSPRKDAFEFFWTILLDSSIMPLGSKIKVVMAISQRIKFKLNSDPLHKVVSYRNAFAHHGLNAHPTVLVGKTPEEDELQYILHIIKQSGKTERKSREAALDEFNANYETAKKALVDLLDSVKQLES